MKTQMTRLLCLFLVVFLGTGTSCGQDRLSRADFVSVADLDSTVVVDMAYNGPDNFMGVRVDSYRKSECLLVENAAEALVRAHQELTVFGMGLKVFDCYRPQSAVNHFVRWAEVLSDTTKKREYYPEVDKSALFDSGYIAERSGHSRGSTVDLTIVFLEDVQESSVERDFDCRKPEYELTGELDMGTGYDCFDRLSHTENPELGDQARRNRLLLRSIMEKHGFDNYRREWWHFTYRGERYRDTYFDFPIE